MHIIIIIIIIIIITIIIIIITRLEHSDCSANYPVLLHQSHIRMLNEVQTM